MAAVLDFESRVSAALATLRRVLDENKAMPARAAATGHTYDDKFALANFVTRVASASLLQTLAAAGLAEATRARAAGLPRRRMLRFRFTETCCADGKVSVEKDSASKLVSSGWAGQNTHKVVTTVTSFKWLRGAKYEIVLFAGPEPTEATTFPVAARQAEWETFTRVDSAPAPAVFAHSDVDVDVTWLLRQPNAHHEIAFEIDRAKAKTPRRNAEIEEALAASADLAAWAVRVATDLERLLAAPQAEAPRRDRGLLAEAIFVPVLPLLRAFGGGAAVLDGGDVAALLLEESRQLEARRAALREAFAKDGEAFTVREATLVCALRHVCDVAGMFAASVNSIEALLRDQLVSAVGSEISAADFERFMRYHAQQLYAPEFAPKPFCFAVRAPGHSAEGTFALERAGEGGALAPIETLSRTMVEPVVSMTFALDAATKVEFFGSRHLHVFMPHDFASPQKVSALQLTARARQFSQYMLLVGRIGAGRTFEPEHALIVRNKDDVRIPLLLTQLPSAKEFRDAIASLSPAQQNFAKAYRAAQLEGSVFAVLAVQLRPQLERVLRLPEGALTKEMALTQRLLDLFIDFQIPSDLLSYDGDAGAALADKLEKVRGHAAAVVALLDAAKQSEIAEAKAAHAAAHPQALYRSADALEEMTAELETSASSFGANSSRGAARRRDAAAPMKMMRKGAPALPSPPPSPCAAPRAAPAASVPGGGQPPRPQSMQSMQESPPPPKPQMPPPGDAAELPAGEQEGEPDLTLVPRLLEAQFEAQGISALRPTKIDVGPVWERTANKGLLGGAKTESLGAAEQRSETRKAFDLLDALTRCGALPLDCCALHAVVAATHCFDDSLIDTLVVRNSDPVEELERASLVIAAAVHALPPPALLKDDRQRDRVAHLAAAAQLAGP
ncbi:hypothetical protein M885DRAFT_464996 [Pelagophyceae sp. CCMP2097]|nr:hypothetical protein M885DRAFT_464996 [Pelagophyceae sp. CCMP2097]